MKIRFWQILCFSLLVVGLSIAIFPGRRSLVSMYLKEGDLQTARLKLKELMKAKEGDEELRLLSSELLSLEGRSEEAIAELEQLVRDNPENVTLLTRLARYYEWDRQAQKALEAWEKVAELAPGNKEALRHQIDYYRYFRLPQKESDAISQLLKAEGLDSSVPPPPILAIIDDEIRNAAARRAVAADTTHYNTLLSGLYLLRVDYLKAIDKKEGITPEGLDKFINRFYSLFLRTGNLSGALRVATRLDRLEKTETKRKQQLLDIVRVEGSEKDALLILTEMRRQFPEKESVLEQIAQLGGSFGDLADNIKAFEKLVGSNPDRTDYKKQLASLYLEVGDPVRAYRLYLHIAETSREAPDVEQMLRVAGYTDEPDILIEALDTASTILPADRQIMETRARLSLAVKGPREAYPLYRQLARSSGGKRDFVVTMLEVAGNTADQVLIREAAEEALKLRPGDRSVLAKTASVLLAQDKAREAYPLYRKLAALDKGASESVAMMLEVAGYTDDEAIIEDSVKEAFRLRPGDRTLVVRAASVLLGQGKPREAYPLYSKLAELSNGNKGDVLQMLKVAEYTDDSAIIGKAADKAVALRPDDQEIIVKAASLHLARNNPEKAYPLYLKLAVLNRGNRDTVLQMLKVAGYTGKPEILAEAAAEAAFLIPDDQELLEKSARILRNSGHPEQAYGFYRRLAELKGGDPEMVLSMLEAAGAAEDKGVLLKALPRAVELQPDNIQVLEKASRYYLWLEMPEEALPLLMRIARMKGADQESILRMVEVASHTEKEELQQEALKIAHELRPDDYAFIKEAIDVAINQYDYGKAIALYEDYQRQKVLNAMEMQELAGLYQENEQPAEAYALMKKLFPLHPDKFSLKRRIVYLAALTEQGKDAEIFFEQQALENPEDYTTNAIAADVFLDRDNKDKGIIFMERALALDPDNRELRARLANLYYREDSFEKAVALLEELEASGGLSQNQELLLNMAYLKSAKGAKVLASLSDLESSEKLPLAEGMLLADAYKSLGRHSDAIRIYRRLISENREDLNFITEMGKQTLWLGYNDIARSLFEEVLRKDPENLEALKYGAEALVANSEFEKAVRLYKKYLSLRPDDYEGYYQLGEAYLSMGQKDFAFAAYRKSERLILEDRELRTGPLPALMGR